MNKIEELQKIIENFNIERDWDKFHSPANLAKSISIEACELLECFQWDEDSFDNDQVSEELADVLIYCFQLASKLNLDISKILLDKINKNNEKYPVDKCKGKATKYTEL